MTIGLYNMGACNICPIHIITNSLHSVKFANRRFESSSLILTTASTSSTRSQSNGKQLSAQRAKKKNFKQPTKSWADCNIKDVQQTLLCITSTTAGFSCLPCTIKCNPVNETPVYESPCCRELVHRTSFYRNNNWNGTTRHVPSLYLQQDYLSEIWRQKRSKLCSEHMFPHWQCYVSEKFALHVLIAVVN